MLAACLLGGCATAGPTTDGAACPGGAAADPARADRLDALLRSDAEGATLLAGEQPLRCFMAGRGAGVLAGRVVLLDSQDDDRRLAARLGHLLVHVRDGIGDGCGRGLVVASDSEQRAGALEQRLARRLGLPVEPVSPAAARDYAERCREP